jgi:hypothetical protein
MKNSLLFMLVLLMGCGSPSSGSSTPTGSTGSEQGSGGAAAGTGGGGGAAGATGNAGTGQPSAGTGGGAGTAGAGGAQDVEAAQQALSGSRLKAYWYAAADGSKQFANRWFDATLGIDCTIDKAPDGKQRCMPDRSYPLLVFSDSGCTSRLVEFPPASTCPTAAPSTPGKFVYYLNESSCYEWRPLGALYTGPTFSGKPGDCKPQTGYSNWTFYSVGAAIDFTMFQEVALAHD